MPRMNSRPVRGSERLSRASDGSDVPNWIIRTRARKTHSRLAFLPCPQTMQQGKEGSLQPQGGSRIPRDPTQPIGSSGSLLGGDTTRDEGSEPPPPDAPPRLMIKHTRGASGPSSARLLDMGWHGGERCGSGCTHAYGSFMIARRIAKKVLPGSGFVKKSAMLSAVRTKGTRSSKSSTMSRTKKWRR